MFLENKYTRWYMKIIERARDRKPVGYSERHHIVPKCLGGSDEKNNQVRLTAREHFIVHKMLPKMTVGKDKMRMSFAFCCFLRNNPMHCGRMELVFTSRDYDRRKTLLSEAASTLHKGRSVSKEAVDKMLESRRRNNKPFPDSAREVHSENMKKRWAENRDEMLEYARTPERRIRVSEANKGVDRLSKEQRTALHESMRGSGNPRARHIDITSPEGHVFHCHGNFHEFCKTHRLPFSSMCHLLQGTREFKKGATVGWSVRYADA